MKKIMGAFILLLSVACQSKSVVKQRLFTPGENRSMTFVIPQGGISLVIQPVSLKDHGALRPGQALDTRTYPYAFQYEALDADHKLILSQAVRGTVRCDPASDPVLQDIVHCPGARVVLDLKVHHPAPRFLKIKLDAGTREARHLFFAVTFRAPQSEYRGRLHSMRLNPVEKASLLDRAYASEQQALATLTSLSTLAPVGRSSRDYQDTIVYQDAARTTQARPNFPNYALIGPQARMIVPLYTRQTPIRVRSFPLADSTEYTLCWQPMAEPVEGRCYQTIKSQTADTTFQLPRGRLILSAAAGSMAMDVEYAVADGIKFKLADAVQQYPVHRLTRGASLSVALGRWPSHESVPLRISVWGIPSASSNPGMTALDVKLLAADGTVRHQERVMLESKLSEFDRPNGELILLNQPHSLYINANSGGGRLVITSPDQDMLASFMLRRSVVPVASRLQLGGFHGADSDRDSWTPVEPFEATPKDVVASYRGQRAAPPAEAQRVSFPSLESHPGSLALIPSYSQEQTVEERKKSGRYVRLPAGSSVQAVLGTDPVLPMVAFAAQKARASLRVNGQALWQRDVRPGALAVNLDVSRFASGSALDLKPEGVDLFLSGIQPKKATDPLYSKRFFYAQSQGTYLIHKESPEQTLTVEILLTEAPSGAAQVSVEVQPGKLESAVITRDLSLLKREYTLEPNPLSPDALLLDGREAQLLTIPIPLRADIPAGDHILKVKTSGLKNPFLAVSSQVPSFGVRLSAAADVSQAIGDTE